MTTRPQETVNKQLIYTKYKCGALGIGQEAGPDCVR